eukprot:m.265895 g.265895  ORF g.265895 m.265895 type:complete len:811 (-) comp19267_c0_seq1:1484-3916(-)
MDKFVPAGKKPRDPAAAAAFRAAALEEAKAEYYAQKKKQEAERKRKERTGEDVWLAPSIENRLGKKDGSKHHKKHKKEKHKKHKKEKKHKKHKSGKKKDDDSSDSGDSDDSDQWVEAPAATAGNDQQADAAADKPKVQRDSWMTAEGLGGGDANTSADLFASFGTISKAPQQPKEEKKPKLEVGQHSRELNPFWKDGGSGLPPERSPGSDAQGSKGSPASGGWKQRAFGKLRESAKRKGRDIDDEMRRKSSFKSNRSEDRSDRDRELRRTSSASRMLKPSDQRTGWRSESTSGSPFGSRMSSPSQPQDGSSAGRKRARSPPSSSRGRRHEDGDDETRGRIHSRSRHDEHDDGRKTVTPASDKDKEAKPVAAAAAAAESAPPPEAMLSEEQLNEMAADAMRAELMGETDKAEQLNKQIAKARALKAKAAAAAPAVPPPSTASGKADEKRPDRKEMLLTRTSRSGMAVPINSPMANEGGGLSGRFQRQRSKLGKTHNNAGERERFFQDDDEGKSIRDMYENERLGMGSSVEEEFMKMASKHGHRVSERDDYSVDDVFVDRAAHKQSQAREDDRQRQKAINESRRLSKSLESCPNCITDGATAFQKQLMLSLGVKTYLALPDRGSLCDGHCLIVPVHHATSTRGVDEDVWDEIKMFQRCLVSMFASKDKDVVFLETVMNLRNQRHTVMHCVPLDKSEGELAPMYFKKGIQDCDQQWSDNVKLIDTRKKGFRSSIPTGFPYFYVAFGNDEGFAHVIEDEKLFPHYFGQEILGNMLDVPARTWLRPHKDKFPIQKQRSMEFLKMWKAFDWTADLD